MPCFLHCLCRNADAYHSCYVLAGLSAVQYSSYYDKHYKEGTYPMDYAMRWALAPKVSEFEHRPDESSLIGSNTVAPIHPVYVIPYENVNQTHSWFRAKQGF